MSITEIELRAALDAVLSIDWPWMQTTLAKFEELKFLPDDPVVRRDSLHARQRAGSGVIAICFSHGGRMLKVMALFGDELQTVTTYRLPREHRPKVRHG